MREAALMGMFFRVSLLLTSEVNHKTPAKQGFFALQGRSVCCCSAVCRTGVKRDERKLVQIYFSNRTKTRNLQKLVCSWSGKRSNSPHARELPKLFISRFFLGGGICTKMVVSMSVWVGGVVSFLVFFGAISIGPKPSLFLLVCFLFLGCFVCFCFLGVLFFVLRIRQTFFCS